ncbi:MAG: hypothetical protein PHP93_04530 [Kiritimatiellales bacterium]|nr:hypothetical protein [Kiritimatiellales bacterium]
MSFAKYVTCFAGIVIIALLSSCTSYNQYIVNKHQMLLDAYPPGMTSRSEVAARWSPVLPDLSMERPVDGWTVKKEPFIAQRLDAIEKKTNRIVARFDRYYGVDGFLSLCRCWFFFDENDRLIDAEWQYVSD